MTSSGREQLQKIADTLQADTQCPLSFGAKHPVPGEGDPNAAVVFIGEAPGAKEDEQGRPFVGRSGTYLDSVLNSSGMARFPRKKQTGVFVTSVEKFRPPDNRAPAGEELAACRRWWQEQVRVIRPKLVVLLGKVASKEVLGKNQPMGTIHGTVFTGSVRGLSVHMMPTYHPAAALRQKRWKSAFEQDIESVCNFVKESA